MSEAAGATARPCSPLPRAIDIPVFAGLVAVAVLPFLVYGYSPVEDGPAHIANAAILLDPGAPGIAEHFDLNAAALVTNVLADVALAGLLLALPAPLADRVMAVFLVLAIPVALRLCVTRLRPGAGWLAVLGIPPAIGLLTYFGFYNFLLGIVLALLAYAWWIPRPRADRIGLPATVGLALWMALVFASHPLPFLVLLTILAADALDVASGRSRGDGRALIRSFARLAVRIGLAAAVPLAAFVLFWSGQRTGLGYTRDLVTRIKAFPVDAVLALSFSEVPLILAFTGGVGLAFLAGLVAARRRLASAPAFPLVAMALVGLYFLGPDAVGKGSFILPRIEFVLILVVLLGLARHPPPRPVGRIAIGLAAISIVGLTAVRLPLHARMDAEIREYLSGAPVVEPGSTVLPLWAVDLDRLYDAGGRRIHPLSERAAYLVATRGAVDLRYFPGYERIFPINFAPGYGIKEWSADPETYRDAFDLGTSVIDLDAYDGWSRGSVDYVWLWGLAAADSARLAAPAARELLEQLTGRYRRIFVSTGGSLEVYARTESEAP